MRRITREDLLASPWNFLAFGFGSGLAKKAPGTFGTLAGIPGYWLVSYSPLWLYSLLTVLMAIVGVKICQKASDWLGVDDHGGIVWDEIVGLLVTFWAVPKGFMWLVLGFALFRFFDILKPWPIGWLDRRLKGGLGVMVDDLVAGVFACVCLHVLVVVL